ncbi:MAG: UbiA-like polyprenyltransferase [Saprospiraceae bacterium]|nr:UbiA-like polyprenyltransferase [Saprospiraceae bacterium]
MRHYLSFIKFAHTVFALPFALVGYVVGLHMPGISFEPHVLILVVLCMVFARSAAMGFNRYADRHIDARNERTRLRELPAGRISARSALIFVIVNAVLFVTCTFFINPLCFYLSPVALMVVLGYSYTKQFTALSHFVLGLGLSLAPVGAYLAATGQFDVIPLLLGAMVLLWVGGFDIIYAMQDREFDRAHALHSIPTLVGPRNALWISGMAHLACAALCVYVVIGLSVQFSALNGLQWAGAGIFLVMLGYQHLLVRPNDLSKVNMAFFTTNGIASVLFGLGVILDFYI